MNFGTLKLAFVLSLTVLAIACDAPVDDSDSPERGEVTSRGKADAPGSCEVDGETFCDKQSPDGCWCDAQCVQFGDCCSDRAPVCEAPEEVPGSCEGSCGGQSADGCWCDEQCAGFGDCCEDITEVCEEEPEPEACAGTPRYRVTLDTTWDPSGVPNPHWSPVVGAVHSGDVSFWSVGQTASSGIEVMAETGATGSLSSEVNAAISAGSAGQALVGPGPISTAAGQTSVVFDTDADFTRVTLVSMMAPSPDWFVGVSGVDLCPDGEWLEGSVNMVVWDAGTDSGTDFTSADADTNPAQPISAASRFVSQGSQVSVGSMNFERID